MKEVDNGGYNVHPVPPPNSEIKERIRKRYESERIKIEKLLTLASIRILSFTLWKYKSSIQYTVLFLLSSNFYHFLILFSSLSIYNFCTLIRLVFWNSIHLEVATDSLCFLINSSWLLVFIFTFFFLLSFTFNLYCWKGIHFS